MRHKLFLAGKRWDIIQSEASIAGRPRSYRITDEASNAAETRCAWAAAKLFCNPVEWNCLHLNDRNMRQRAEAFRLISRQVAMVFLLLYIPHLVGPFSLFNDLDGNLDSFDMALGQPSCFYGDFMYHHMKEFPSAADLLGKTSMFILLCIADMVRTQSTRSENGHAFWQREARLRSVQTACADYDDISAIVFLHQCRLAELSHEIHSAPVKKGRRKQVKPKKLRKRKGVKKPNAKKKYVSKKAPRPRRGNPYNAFVAERATGAEGKGGDIFRGLAGEYRAQRDTHASQKLRMKSDAMAMQRAGIHITSNTRTLIASSTSLACEVQRSLVACEPSRARPACDVTGIMAAFEANANSAIARLGNLSSGVSTLRAAFRKAHELARSANHEAGLQLVKWVFQASSALGNVLISDAPAVDGVFVAPSDHRSTKIQWKVPAIRFMERFALCAKEPRTVWHANADDPNKLIREDLHATLRKSWAKRGKQCLHKDQPKLENIKPSKMASSLCRHFVFCVCKRADLLLFRSAFLAMLRPLYKKSANNPHKNKIENAHYVLHMEWASVNASLAPASPSVEQFYHVANANQLSWAVVLMRLHRDTEPLALIHARAAGNIALRGAPAGLGSLMNPFEVMGIDIIPRIFKGDDLVQTCCYTVLEIIAPKHDLISFNPSQIEVKTITERTLPLHGTCNYSPNRL